MMFAQIETAIHAIDKASGATDRWLFLAALGIIILGGTAVIRWLVAGLERKDATHQEEMQGMRAAHTLERSEWRAVMETSKAEFLNAITKQRQDFREELSAERHACANERALDREARHATANALNSVGMGLTLLNEQILKPGVPLPESRNKPIQ